MSNKLNVGVLFRNNEEFVNPFFFFLRKSTIMNLRMIVVDNGSTDKTADEIQKHIKKDDVFIRSVSNVGIAGGRNLILEAMKKHDNGYTDLLLFDSDVFIVRQDSINRMYDMFSLDNRCGMVFGTVRSFQSFSLSAVGICFCLIRKEVFELQGGFDPQFKMFYDDTDFVHQMETRGKYKVSVCEKAMAVHMWGSTIFKGSEGGKIREEALLHDRLCYEKKWNCKLEKVT